MGDDVGEGVIRDIVKKRKDRMGIGIGIRICKEERW
jgi:hypothetical protein